MTRTFNINTSLFICIVLIGLALQGCGSGGGSGSRASCEVEGCRADVTLSWGIPVARENGDYVNISEIGRFYILMRKEPEEFKSISTEGVVSSYVFRALEPGQWQFKVATMLTSGLLSKYSDVVGITINTDGTKTL